jgi:ABC-type multidrug transport system ATPase subunit
MALSDWAVSIENLGFRYPGNDHVSFSGLNLQVAKGERFGLFGPNGAGKTTLMNLMTGVLKADTGSVKYLGLYHRTFLSTTSYHQPKTWSFLARGRV